jgi:hypothetical protein
MNENLIQYNFLPLFKHSINITPKYLKIFLLSAPFAAQ